MEYSCEIAMVQFKDGCTISKQDASLCIYMIYMYIFLLYTILVHAGRKIVHVG